MSKICLITAQNVQMSPDSLRRRIVDLLAERNIGAFFPTASNVGLTEYEGAFVCSISDDFLYDNCERLLLPDDCWYNGTCSSAPFAERMNSVCDIVRYAADCAGEVELFIGDCGQCPLTEKALFPKQYDALSHELPDVSDEISKSQTRRRTEMSSGGSSLSKKSSQDFFDKLHPPSSLIISKCCFAPKVIDISILLDDGLLYLRRALPPQAPPLLCYLCPAAHVL